MNRDEFLQAMRAMADVKPTPVPVPKLGTVYVKPRTLEEVDADSEREAAEQEKDKSENRHRRLARAVAHVVCDESGARIIDPQNNEEIELLCAQPYYVLRKILNAAGGGDEDEGKSNAGNS